MTENPFFNRGPIREPRYFFGRDRETEQVLGLLRQMQNVSIVGPIKVGKTSLLLHLARDQVLRDHGLAPDQYLFVYLSFEGLIDLTQPQFFHLLLQGTLKQGGPQVSPQMKTPQGDTLSFVDFRTALEQATQGGLRIVYLFDEFELSAENPNLDLNFFSALRNLASHPSLAFVTATQESLHTLALAGRQVGSPFADLFTTIWLGPFLPEEAKALIEELSADAGIPLSQESEFIIQLANHHPFFIQLLASNVIEQRMVHPQFRPADHIYLRQQFFIQAEPYLYYIWAGLSTRERRALLEIQSGEIAKAVEPDIIERLQQQAIIVLRDDQPQISCQVIEEFLNRRRRELRSGGEGLLEASEADTEPTERVALPADMQSIYRIVRALVKATEAKDEVTKGHSDGVAIHAVAIAQAMNLPPEQVEGIKIAARLHDIGKIGVSDLILLKPGPLSPQEREIVEAHCLISDRILDALEFPWPIRPAIRFHHERWDGSGYPDGLMGDEIPLEARILAVADVFDAMTSPRAHRPALPVEKALAELTDHVAIKYDPKVVAAFLQVLEKSKRGKQRKR